MYAGQYFVDYDETGSIGKRYRRQDEIGTPLCVTVDFESLEDHQVTVRDRDKMTQARVALDQLKNYLEPKIITDNRPDFRHTLYFKTAGVWKGMEKPNKFVYHFSAENTEGIQRPWDVC